MRAYEAFKLTLDLNTKEGVAALNAKYPQGPPRSNS